MPPAAVPASEWERWNAKLWLKIIELAFQKPLT
nr:MAG TPA: hypothetical protein [Caudoviricetes sp.]